MTREEKEQWDIFMRIWVIPALKNTWGEKKCKEIVEALEEWEEQEPWISVSKKLPEIHNGSDNYLVTLKRGGVHIAMFTECDGKHWWTYDDVEAWMPLPKPYEAKNKKYTCDKKQEKTRLENMIDAINFAIKVTDSQDDYSMGMRNGMRYVRSLIDGEQPRFEIRRTNEEIELGLDIGDEVIGDFGAKGIVLGIDTYEGDVVLSLLMGNHKVPQIVKASSYKTKTGRHFPQIIEVLEQIKGESDGK